jgi:tetratricopeptide (TPR) repeat protein
MTPSTPLLTQTELLALALEAIRKGDSGQSLGYLKEAAARSDATAEVCFLLGSEYAQLKLMEEARIHMHRAIEIAPAYAIARFQLGLLYLTHAMPNEAQAVWEPLTELGTGHPLGAFHQGLVHLIRDEAQEALHWLAQGVGLNTDNPALNHDMQLIIAELQRLQASGAAPSVPMATSSEATPAEAAAEAENHLFLSTYQRGKVH